MDGTHDEMVQSIILDNTKFHIRCLIDEKWIKDSSIKTSWYWATADIMFPWKGHTMADDT